MRGGTIEFDFEWESPDPLDSRLVILRVTATIADYYAATSASPAGGGEVEELTAVDEAGRAWDLDTPTAAGCERDNLFRPIPGTIRSRPLGDILDERAVDELMQWG